MKQKPPSQQVSAREHRRRRTLLNALLAFAQDDLPGGTTAERERVTALVIDIARTYSSLPDFSSARSASKRWRQTGLVFSPSDGFFVSGWTHAHTTRWHRQLRGILAAVLPRRLDEARPPHTEPYAYLPTRVAETRLYNRKGRIVRVDVPDAPSVWDGVAELLTTWGPWLRRCKDPACERVFIRTRRQEYCSRRCSQRVRSAEWYASHRRDATAARRERYRIAMTGGSERKIGSYRRTRS